jgi:hypothetical protein
MIKRLLAFSFALLFFAGCQPGSQSADTDTTATAPSPSAPTMPPPDSVDVAEIPSDSTTRARFNAMMNYARQSNLAERPTGEIVQALGTQLLGRPYLIKPLDQTVDQTPAEQLVCRLDGFDCFTFDEAMLAMARAVKSGNRSYDDYKRFTRQLRYRDGEIGYCNRMHYYTEFIKQAEERGVLRNVTQDLGGKRLNTTYAFMGENRSEYPQLKSDSLYQCIQNVEERLNRTMTNYYIPQDSIRAVYDRLKAGDLIATATDIEGLDVTHTGLVYKGESDTTGLLHASTSGGVKISPDLQEYVKSIDSQIGVIVARPQN